jgi:hypothetical protein
MNENFSFTKEPLSITGPCRDPVWLEFLINKGVEVALT